MKYALALSLVAAELLGVAGLILVLNGGLEQIALIAVCCALIVVPILFGVAMLSERKRQRRGDRDPR